MRKTRITPAPLHVSLFPMPIQGRRYRGGLGPPLFIQGGRAPPNYLTTALSKEPKLPYYWLGICTKQFPSSAHQADEGLCLCFLVLETKVTENALLMNINEQNFARRHNEHPHYLVPVSTSAIVQRIIAATETN